MGCLLKELSSLCVSVCPSVHPSIQHVLVWGHYIGALPPGLLWEPAPWLFFSVYRIHEVSLTLGSIWTPGFRLQFIYMTCWRGESCSNLPAHRRKTWLDVKLDTWVQPYLKLFVNSSQ